MRKRARLIYNPTSGREQITKVLPDILQVYEKAGYETSAFQTTPKLFSAKHEARRCARDGFDLIIAAGGDGTVNEVVAGISKLKYRPKVAVLPAGTTNDFARALRIPRDNLVKAAQLINKESTVLMDIGRVTLESDDGKIRSKYFMNIGAAGSLTELTYDVPAQLKSVFGPLAYVAKGIEFLPRLSGVPLKIKYDDGIYDGEASLVFMSLTNSVGGFEKIAPDSVMGDGKYTLIIVTTSNLVELTEITRKAIIDGSHINNKHIIYTKTSNVEISTQDDSELLINLDGELGGKAPATFENYQQHIEFIADRESIEKKVKIKSPKEAEMENKITNQFLESLDNIEKNN